MKGIILAGGTGTRLYPITLGTSKQLLPVYDKPMIYYPLSVLMLAGIREILIITTPDDQQNFRNILADGSQWGIKLSYEIQREPNGIAEAFIIAEDFIGTDNVALILGDNIFYGYAFSEMLNNVRQHTENGNGATIFAYHVSDPERFGIVEFDKNKTPVAIHEKPSNPPSNYAVVGLYFYDNNVVNIARTLHPSRRGELEITDINNEYIARQMLQVQTFGRGFAWLDTGTHETLMEAGQFVSTIEARQGLKVACLEEIAYKQKWITKQQLSEQAKRFAQNPYGTYLQNLIQGDS